MFSVENAKSEHHQWILLIQISLGSKVQLKLTILISWTKFDQKGYFRSKTKKRTPSMNFAYLNYSRYQISGETDKFWFFGYTLPKKGISGLKQKVLRAWMVVTYKIKLFYIEDDRHNGILMSLLLLVAETKETSQRIQKEIFRTGFL